MTASDRSSNLYKAARQIRLNVSHRMLSGSDTQSRGAECSMCADWGEDISDIEEYGPCPMIRKMASVRGDSVVVEKQSHIETKVNLKMIL